MLMCIMLSLQMSAFAYEPNSWAVEEVNGAIRLSIISDEYATKPFSMDITRSDFVNVAMNLYATITAENISTNAKQPFTDTNDIFPNMAYYAGIVSGDGEGHFFPLSTLTRQEMCKIITSVLSAAGVLGPYYPSENVFAKFTDADQIAVWARDYVAFMLDAGLMSGDAEGTFRPADNVTREEAALIAYRCFLKYGKDYQGQIQTTLKSTRDSHGNIIQTLSKTIVLPNGATVALRNADDPNAAEMPDPVMPDGSAGTAPSGTPLQTPGDDGLYRLKTFSETLATGEAAEKEARIFGDAGRYTTYEEAEAHMTSVTVNVWKLDGAGKLYPSTLTFRINSVLKDDVIAIFNEIFNSEEKPPIKDATGYGWRSPMANGNLSDHNYGTVIDLNYNENYCVYQSGTTIGSFYDPENSVYSFKPAGIVIQTFAKYGWLWGGNAWVSGTMDYMHFTYLGK